ILLHRIAFPCHFAHPFLEQNSHIENCCPEKNILDSPILIGYRIKLIRFISSAVVAAVIPLSVRSIPNIRLTSEEKEHL
ncbi:MAG: hypothetical protein JXB38_10530, partial [Anaerolineales bacterium]|nr:hypothetical protein [Anaerolineales bacterium]